MGENEKLPHLFNLTPYEPAMKILIACFAILGLTSLSLAQDLPKIEVPGIRLSPVAKEPEIVTPVSCAFDAKGDFYVIESNTHFRPDNYPGPKFDRVYRYPAGTLDKPNHVPEVFLENTTHTMQICPGPGDWIYISTRREVRRYSSRGKLPQGEGELILKLDTKGDYPHNGLSGMVVSADGKLYVGMGENLGEPYTLLNSKDEKILGGGEGGNIFRCDLDGKNLERIATGFWNPFGLCFDEAGRLWAVDNDPDASPPCRLVHVVPGGDYGFEFQFGRAGTNPLIAWHGQLPGTLGYAAGTGESPCAVVMKDGYLWVTSWGDNKVERFQVRLGSDQSATLLANPEVVIQGGPQFRPVGMALSPSGSLFFTDWVDRSYTLHGLGKIWRIDLERSIETIPGRSSGEKLALTASGSDSLWQPVDFAERTNNRNSWREGCNSSDPFLRTAAMWGLLKSGELQALDLSNASDGIRIVAAMARHWQDLNHQSSWSKEQRASFLAQTIADKNAEVRMIGLRWIAEVKEVSLRGEIDELLKLDRSDQEFRLAMATLDFLDRGMADRSEIGGHRVASTIVRDEQRPLELRTTSLSLLGPNEPSLKTEELLSWAKKGGSLGREATRMLALRGDEVSQKALGIIVEQTSLDSQQKADAVMGLAGNASAHLGLLEKLSSDSSLPVSKEAKRVLARVKQTKFTENRPKDENINAWDRRIASNGSIDAGWRVFFRAGAGQCSACHSYRDRGAKVGPDLSTIGNTQTSTRILESLLQPNREVGPLYVPWSIQTKDGNLVTGIKLHTPGAGGKTRFLAGNGTFVDIDLTEIEEQHMVTQSIMPSGLLSSMDDEEIADLLALLRAKR